MGEIRGWPRVEEIAMGMFDSVMLKCPKCASEVEFQSKAGDCDGSIYGPADAPMEILASLHDKVVRCRCGHDCKLAVSMSVWLS